MLEAIEAYDVVVGSRYVKGGRTDDRWGWGRWFLSWWANSVWVRLALGVRTKDATAGFKCWQADALRRMDLEQHPLERVHLPGGDVLRGRKDGPAHPEIPIYFEDRRIGQSKMDLRVQVEAALRVFEIRLRQGRRKKVGASAAADR